MADCREALKNTKLALRVLGSLVCLFFLVQAIVMFANTPGDMDFWEFCHWLGQGMLAVFVGGFGIAMEFHGTMSHVATSFKSYLVNRLALFLFYTWLGCYIMGGMDLYIGEAWRTLSHIAGVVAWVVAVGDLLVSWSGYEPHKPQAGADGKSAEPAAAEIGAATSRDDVEVRPADTPSWSPARNAAPQPSVGSAQATTGGQSISPKDDAAPAVEEPIWNDFAFDKPFGST